MIKLKLTDPTRKEKEIQEYVVNEQGFVALRKTSGLVYQSSVIQKWIDYAGNYDRKVIGYLKMNFSRSEEGDMCSKTDFLMTNKPAIGLTPLILVNSTQVESNYPNLTIEEIVEDFDVNSIPPKQREIIK